MLFGTFFALLYTAHHLSDYPFQTDRQARCKADRSVAGWRANLTHAGTHVLTTAVLLAAAVWLLPDAHVTMLGAATALGWIGFSHSLIDRRRLVRWWMEHTGQTGYIEHGGLLTVDQAFHIGLGLMPGSFALAVL